MTVWNDYILYALRTGNPELQSLPDFNTLILDETQDMTNSLYWLVTKYLDHTARRSGKSPRLILPDQLFSDYSPDAWKHLILDQSFRLSHQNA